MQRTHTCGELSEKEIGQIVTLSGWVGRRRDHGNLIFIDLRDRYGITQVVFNPETEKKSHTLAQNLGKEWVIQISGKVTKRPKGTENFDIPTGQIDVAATKLTVLNESVAPLPVEVDEYLQTSEDQRLKYRFVDLRRKEMQNRLLLRHSIMKEMRDYLHAHLFAEIETPILAKSTPEGARDYLVPSRVHPGKFYALPQSPQLFKQLLMVSGFDRYMQIVKCFRDEDLRADRQPEFTQLDLEMSFVEEEDVMDLMDGLFHHLFKEILGKDMKIPFPRMTYKDAMETYGSDSPDTRFGMELIDVSKELSGTEFNVFTDTLKNGGVIKGIVAKNAASFSRKETDSLTDKAKSHGALGLVVMKVTQKGIDSQVSKFLKQKDVSALLTKTKAEQGDLLLLVASDWVTACTSLGAVRSELGKKLELIDGEKNAFVWVTEFPVVEFNEEEQRLTAVHHPFTAPLGEDVSLLEKEPEKARARAYDLTWNGQEIGGGSIRIHQRKLQEQIFKVLGISKKEAEEKFGFLLDAFKYGAPPHGGIAFGLDRIVAKFVGTDNIREVIAFPKNKQAVSPMDDAPSEVSLKQLKEVGLKLDVEKE
jgi:aspartyl-tRNA synthetase